jgi:hypothetical protein
MLRGGDFGARVEVCRTMPRHGPVATQAKCGLRTAYVDPRNYCRAESAQNSGGDCAHELRVLLTVAGIENHSNRSQITDHVRTTDFR